MWGWRLYARWVFGSQCQRHSLERVASRLGSNLLNLSDGLRLGDVAVAGGHGHGRRAARGLFGEGEQLLEHELASVLGELVDVGGRETLCRDGLEDCT